MTRYLIIALIAGSLLMCTLGCYAPPLEAEDSPIFMTVVDYRAGRGDWKMPRDSTDDWKEDLVGIHTKFELDEFNPEYIEHRQWLEKMSGIWFDDWAGRIMLYYRWEKEMRKWEEEKE